MKSLGIINKALDKTFTKAVNFFDDSLLFGANLQFVSLCYTVLASIFMGVGVGKWLLNFQNEYWWINILEIFNLHLAAHYLIINLPSHLQFVMGIFSKFKCDIYSICSGCLFNLFNSFKLQISCCFRSSRLDVNFAKFLRTPFLTEHLRWVLLLLFTFIVALFNLLDETWNIFGNALFLG